MFQYCFFFVSLLFQSCFRVVSLVFQCSYLLFFEVSSVFLWCFILTQTLYPPISPYIFSSFPMNLHNMQLISPYLFNTIVSFMFFWCYFFDIKCTLLYIWCLFSLCAVSLFLLVILQTLQDVRQGNPTTQETYDVILEIFSNVSLTIPFCLNNKF